MARTKQTAKKTTGAPAPRLALGSLPARSFINSSVTRHSTRVSKHSGAVSGGGIQGNEVSGNNVRSNVRCIDILLTMFLQFCSGCRNGGMMSVCSHCPRAYCDGCVIIPPTYPEDAEFTCPYCHIFSGLNGKRAKKPSPYPVSYAANLTLKVLMDVPVHCRGWSIAERAVSHVRRGSARGDLDPPRVYPVCWHACYDGVSAPSHIPPGRHRILRSPVRSIHDQGSQRVPSTYRSVGE